MIHREFILNLNVFMILIISNETFPLLKNKVSAFKFYLCLAELKYIKNFNLKPTNLSAINNSVILE